MGSTDLHEDYKFLTNAHDHAATDAIWLVKRFDPAAHFIQLYKVEPKDKIGTITVHCFELLNAARQGLIGVAACLGINFRTKNLLLTMIAGVLTVLSV